MNLLGYDEWLDELDLKNDFDYALGWEECLKHEIMFNNWQHDKCSLCLLEAKEEDEREYQEDQLNKRLDLMNRIFYLSGKE